MSESLVKELSQPIFDAKGWMRFVGVMSIIYGILTALTIVGILVAWIPIWFGILLFQSASSVEHAHESGDGGALSQSLGKLKSYFILMGVLSLIGLIVTLGALLVGGAGFMQVLSGL